jgi:endo-1,4-beta-xylanase
MAPGSCKPGPAYRWCGQSNGYTFNENPWNIGEVSRNAASRTGKRAFRSGSAGPPKPWLGLAMNRRRFLKSFGAATAWASFTPTRLVAAAEAESRLDQAREGIAHHRQSELIIRVTDDAGRPLPGLALNVEQLRHDFLWGANLFGWSKPGEPEIEAAYRTRFANLFNYATLDFYWHTYEPEAGQPRYARTEAMANWCRTHRITAKGHPLVWANIPDPDWLPADHAGIQTASLGRVRDIVSRFRDRIDLWDVVNEPSLLLWADTRLGAWAHQVGSQSFVTQHLRAARAANPAATLLVNEVLTDYPVYPLLESLRAESEPLLDAVGLQSHMHRGVWPLDRLWRLCDRFGGLGVPLHFTEFTILSAPGDASDRWTTPTPESEQAQSERVSEHYTLLFGHPAVAAVSWWDLSDRGAWKSAPAGLLRADMSPKPAYDRLHELIRKRWWTNADGSTNADGRFACRAFHGHHRVTVRQPDGRESRHDAACTRAGKNQVKLTWKPAEAGMTRD